MTFLQWMVWESELRAFESYAEPDGDSNLTREIGRSCEGVRRCLVNGTLVWYSGDLGSVRSSTADLGQVTFPFPCLGFPICKTGIMIPTSFESYRWKKTKVLYQEVPNSNSITTIKSWYTVSPFQPCLSAQGGQGQILPSIELLLVAVFSPESNLSRQITSTRIKNQRGCLWLDCFRIH